MFRFILKSCILAIGVYVYVYPQIVLEGATWIQQIPDLPNVIVKSLSVITTLSPNMTWLISFGVSSFFSIIALIQSSSTSTSNLFFFTFLSICQAAIANLSLISTAIVDPIDLLMQKNILYFAMLFLHVIIILLALFPRRFFPHVTFETTFRKRLIDFYKIHNPEKIRECDKILEKYFGNEELLFRRLEKKYRRKEPTSDDSEYKRKEPISNDSEESEEESDVDEDAGASNGENLKSPRTKGPITSEAVKEEAVKEAMLSPKKAQKNIESVKEKAVKEAIASQQARVDERIRQLSAKNH